jgi:hypothetical protein
MLRIVSTWLGLAWLVGCWSSPAAPIDEQGARECARAPVLVAPSEGCATIEYVATEGGCTLRTEPPVAPQAVPGGFIRLERPAARGAVIRMRFVEGPRPCVSDGSGCPNALVTRPNAAGPCTCVPGSLDALSLPLEEVFEWPMTYEAQDLLLGPNGARFEVSLCATGADPYPTCVSHLGDAGTGVMCGGAGSFVSGGHCVCLPPCETSDQCPATSSAAVPTCRNGGCVLACATSSECPPSQSCIDMAGARVCMSMI